MSHTTNRLIRALSIFVLLLFVTVSVLFFLSLFIESKTTETFPKQDKIVYSKPLLNEEIRAQLGKATWTLLHTIAARYPSEPSVDMKIDTLKFVTLLSRLYPCGQCAEEFQSLLKESPPKLDTADHFQQWLCETHNKVNLRLKKEEFDCSRLDERWDCGCNE